MINFNEGEKKNENEVKKKIKTLNLVVAIFCNLYILPPF